MSTLPKFLAVSITLKPKVSSKYHLNERDIGEAQGTIHPEAKFLSSCALVKPGKLVLPSDNGGAGIG